MRDAAKIARTLVGVVVSNKMDRTISVLVERKVKHPLYRKYVKKSTKLMAHDQDNECVEGDTVTIEECRPISKKKSWRLQAILSKAAQV
ncbi:MAG: 30S ribosomal protein S17 [Pseudomonadota bacterium]|nr:30S ribosomal protein S17 [Pseudomonadota bacterium]